MGGQTSDWLRVLGGVPQGTRTGPIAFLFMINDLLSNRHHAKFVDDTTVWELCEDRGATSEMAAIAAETEVWSAVNNMVLNGDKTKEMVIHFGRTGADTAPVLIDNTVVEQVTSFKLLGCTVNNQLSWQDHVDCIYAKASRGLYFLCLLRRTGVKPHDIVRVFTSAGRSILEYACASWHTCLTGQQSEKIESIQRRAMCIVAPDLSYRQALANFGLPTLKERRERLARDFFIKIVRNPDHKLRHLLPHEKTIKYGLRTAKPDQNPTYNTVRTKKTLREHVQIVSQTFANIRETSVTFCQ